jgi:hypothetical protein
MFLTEAPKRFPKLQLEWDLPSHVTNAIIDLSNTTINYGKDILDQLMCQLCIKDTTLAVEKPGFRKYWDINKDKIHVCKDCEFRYICTDCRAYVEDPEDILSKPLKCDYNLYTGEWSEWSTNPLKQKAIDFYGMREMVDEMGGGVEAT